MVEGSVERGKTRLGRRWGKGEGEGGRKVVKGRRFGKGEGEEGGKVGRGKVRKE